MANKLKSNTPKAAEKPEKEKAEKAPKAVAKKKTCTSKITER
jgi:hypothetical protein